MFVFKEAAQVVIKILNETEVRLFVERQVKRGEKNLKS